MLSLILWTAFWVFVYVWFCCCLQIIGDKTGTPGSWLAWVPIANLWYMVKISGQPWWMFVLLWIPIANLIALVVVWNKVIERWRGKPSMAGILMLVPVLNYMILTRLAFVDEAPAA